MNERSSRRLVIQMDLQTFKMIHQYCVEDGINYDQIVQKVLSEYVESRRTFLDCGDVCAA
jgi:hypothetical protein